MLYISLSIYIYIYIAYLGSFTDHFDKGVNLPDQTPPWPGNITETGEGQGGQSSKMFPSIKYQVVKKKSGPLPTIK